MLVIVIENAQLREAQDFYVQTIKDLICFTKIFHLIITSSD